MDKSVDKKMDKITDKNIKQSSKETNETFNEHFVMDLLKQMKENNVKTHKTFKTIIILLIAALFVSNMAWLYVFQSYDYASYEYQQDGEGYNNINHEIKGDVINNNGAKSKNQNEDEERPSEGQSN